MTVFEVTRGYRRVKRDSKLESFERALLACDVLPFDDPAARIAGRMYAELELCGRTVGMPDVMIAAIAVRNGLAIATGNVAHFEAIRSVGYELEISNWRTWRPT